MGGSVAVIIPCFDDGDTLGEAVATAQRQDMAVETIVVDDGSSHPDTVRALERLEGAGFRILHQANQGPARARLAGARATGADYVFMLDADDRLLRGALGRLRMVLDRHPDAAAAWGSVRHFGAVEFVQRSRPCLDPWQISYQNHLPSSALFRRSALLEIGWEATGGYEDWDLWMALAERGWQGVGVPELVAEHRVRPGRRLSHDARRHDDRYTTLRARHPRLFAERARHRRASRAPLLLKLALPGIEALPLSTASKRLLVGLVGHVAYREGYRTLSASYRAHQVLRGR